MLLSTNCLLRLETLNVEPSQVKSSWELGTLVDDNFSTTNFHHCLEPVLQVP